MKEFLDQNLLDLITNLQRFFAHYYGHFVSFGQALGGVFCLIIVAKEAYQMMQLQKGIDVTVFIRPLIIAIVLSQWAVFTGSIRGIFSGLDGWARTAVYEKELMSVDQLHQQRWELQVKQYQVLQQHRAEAEIAKDAIKEDKGKLAELFDNVKDQYNKLLDASKMYRSIINTSIAWAFEKIIEFLSLLLWHCFVYLTFFVREIGLGILTITGPISFGMSVLPIWKDAWSSWVTRYISFCLYGMVAYFVMSAALQLFKYGIQVDIQRLSTPGVLWGDIINFNGFYSLIGSIVGGYGLKMVPEIVTWIVPANSSHAASQFAGGVAGSAKKAATTAVKVAAAAI